MFEPIPIQDLLAKTEGPHLDFKSKQYRLNNEHLKACLIKDILCMANTPRQDAAYIVIGVKAHPDGTKEIVGVDSHHDDASLQALVAAKTSPAPEFRYIPVDQEGKSLAVLEIPAVRRGPFVPRVDFGNALRRNAVYWRRGSQNDEARSDELKHIVAWMRESQELEPLDSIPQEISMPHWDEFHDACHKFDDGWLYILVVPPETRVAAEDLAGLGRVNWSLVLDFDPDTDKSGAHAAARDELRERRSVHLLTLEDRTFLDPQRATYWVAARGLSDRPSTLVAEGWRAWNRKYAIGLRVLLSRLAESSAEMPVTLVVLWDDDDYVRTVCDGVDFAFGDAVDIVFAAPDPQRVSSLVRIFGGESVAISLAEVCQGLVHARKSRVEEAKVARLPAFESEPIVLSVDELRWLEEDLELVHLGAGQQEMPGRVSGFDFYRGMAISWFELAMHRDIDREITGALLEQVKSDLRSRSTIRINLYHWPGAGGTTLARRLAWELHEKHPTVQLRRIRGEETVARLRTLFDRTKLPPLVLVDGADVSLNELEGLYTQLRSRQLPSVFLTILRRFQRPTPSDRRSGERVAFLGSTLSLPETHKFAQAYAEQVPPRRPTLEQIVERGDPRERTPFYFGLVTFAEDFISLGDYVAHRLEAATEVQKQVTLFMAMVYHYAQKALPDQIFAGLLGMPENRPVRLERVLADPLRDLLVKEDGHRWRPVHELVAQEVLEQTLAGASDRRTWKQNLSNWATEFAHLCAHRSGIHSQELMDIVRRTFVLRDNQELLGTEASYRRRYSQLIEDIPTKEGKLNLLQRLVELFPQEAHFWGHLGRLYSIEFEDDEQALVAIDRAIDLEPDDNVLRHMKGMALRRQAYALMDKARTQKQCTAGTLQEISVLVSRAGEQFAKARELLPEDEHGYVSHIQLLIKTVDFGFQVSGTDSRETFLGSRASMAYQEMLDTAEGLLEDLQGLRQGQDRSVYLVRCEAALSELYGDYSRVLERWTNLLARRDIYQPLVRRQLVRAYLARRARTWDKLEEREIARVLELMEENMLQEPGNDRNIRLWFQAARRSLRYGIETAMEKLSYWRANSDSLDAKFYLYVLHVLQALDGSALARGTAHDLITECSQRAQGLRNRHYSLEWLGHGTGMKRIVHYSRLGDEWEREFERGDLLALADGRIAHISGPEAGKIELSCGLRAFFVPSRGHQDQTFVRGRDENKPVQFYLAFTYDGLRAWNVREVSPKA